MKTEQQKLIEDRQLLERLGGPTRVAELLGYDKHGGAQRVQNWISRGIPPKVKIDHQDIFLSQEQTV
jgi:hypothetical protein